jgi:hypothetical protein
MAGIPNMSTAMARKSIWSGISMFVADMLGSVLVPTRFISPMNWNPL